MACTKPNRPFENIYVLDMALPKTPNYVAMLKKLKKDLSSPPHPLLTKCRIKQNKLSTQQRVNFASHICNYKGYNEPLAFNSSSKAN
jgi:hypothetical protein